MWAFFVFSDTVVIFMFAAKWNTGSLVITLTMLFKVITISGLEINTLKKDMKWH